jgi:hypothetical protein
LKLLDFDISGIFEKIVLATFVAKTMKKVASPVVKAVIIGK